jgi:glucosylglycerate phosphorylase
VPNKKNASLEKKLYDHIAFIYGQDRAAAIHQRLLNQLNQFNALFPRQSQPSRNNRVTERDSVLITYGDMIQHNGTRPLQTLGEFLQNYLAELISTVHILPFFPYSSDDGFSVIDYRQVNPELGDWEDIASLGEHFRLMFDAVVNHISAQSMEFQGYLKGDPAFETFFLSLKPDTDLSSVFRPRTTPVLTPFQTARGEEYIWTTFNDDQIDLNYASPDVLLEVIDVLLFYIAHGAELIRLDAITFIWKEIGTTCASLPRTHRLVQLMRTVLDLVAPHVIIITETNVPHKENISYFGNGADEAQMVYNFSLPPLILHTFHTGNATSLSQWADSLTLPSDRVTFFNFLASHDGIGLTPARGILSEAAINAIAERVEALGGYVSYKNNPDGGQAAYELNINYLDALCVPGPVEPIAWIARRFLAAQAIMLALRGVPGIYFHSLFGSRGWRDGAQQSGRPRTINRRKPFLRQIETELADSNSLRQIVFRGYAHLLRQRTAHPAFHPNAEQQIVFCHAAVFAMWRRSPERKSAVLCLHNVSAETHELHILLQVETQTLRDMLTGAVFLARDGLLNLSLQPYEVRWLVAENA